MRKIKNDRRKYLKRSDIGPHVRAPPTKRRKTGRERKSFCSVRLMPLDMSTSPTLRKPIKAFDPTIQSQTEHAPAFCNLRASDATVMYDFKLTAKQQLLEVIGQSSGDHATD
jgi:hypothetical protein